ncbi:3'5'-cyclic nucleotide phosphodiesterase family protein [Trichomonas vaginalis G3]|uniref:3'5'-cyclic nucleotide phosphodiesterase family protein n=1 Tax=Trichomonas vaginalis (strain ATCC PRA-98 / G3) TaxID=412133 RepID=A2DBZ3_TRIV3|nr:3',5'-cyclic-nucleotide phosphodiesterase protein [Trichomonas vaginalis G3]EAY22034.1 3'5'-cyclic nucleotide phosphodiesterase family protein [Trichomonas vaginalis G3]KAI5525341.1 3',5'-cyclic-nucleotide phosphodiesterase protein [Trichomonas vaginalis G3]|eukprot:XP_001583020.1 3'5'-cyclic nucleotide phosphodiesterase family protein [Trichomonas vaginalis G3]
MKNIGADFVGGFPRIASPLNHTPKTTKKPRPASGDTTGETMKSLSKLNQQLSSNLFTAESQRDLLNERIDMLEQQVIADQDFIANLRARIANLSESATISQATSPRNDQPQKKVDPKVIAAAAEITSDSIFPFLQNRPLAFFHLMCNKSDVSIDEIIDTISSDLIVPLFHFSLKQINRFATFFSHMGELSTTALDPTFIELTAECVRNAYFSEVCYVFIRDELSGEFFCTLGNKLLQVNLKGMTSTIASVAQLQKPTILLEPEKYPDYSPSLDPLFNPGNLPEIIIPVGRNAVFLVIKTDPQAYDYTNEDIALGTMISKLLLPLFEQHFGYRTMMMEVEHRRNLRQFELDLSTKTSLEILIPFLLELFNSLICANDVKIFVFSGTFLLTFEVEDHRLVQKTLDRKGIPQWIYENKKYVYTEKLNLDIPGFDFYIDGWSTDKPYIAYPVYGDTKDVIGVVCVSDKIGSNKFSNWDMEFMESMSAMMAVVLPRCIDALQEKRKSEGELSLEKLPLTLEKIAFEDLEKSDSYKNILMKTMELIKAEWISFYIKKDNEDAKRILTMQNDEIKDEIIVTSEFVEQNFNTMKEIVAPDVKRVEGFDIVGNFNAKSLICITNVRHDEKVFIIAMNNLSKTGQFSDEHIPILYVMSNYLIYTLRLQNKNNQIENAKSGNVVMENVFKTSSEALKSSDPFSFLLNQFAETTMLKNFAVFRVRFQIKKYEVLVKSENAKNEMIDTNDIIFTKTEDFFYTADFKNSAFLESKIVQNFPEFNQMIVQKLHDGLYLVLAGNEVHQNYQQLISYFLPSLKSFSLAFLPRPPLCNIVNLHASKLLDTDVSSRLFVSRSLSDSEKTECAMKFFINAELLNAIGGDLEKLTNFVTFTRENYNENLKFHNFEHALDFTQFVFVCLTRNKFGNCMNVDQKAALLCASLLHDVNHDGTNTLFLNQTSSYLVDLYGKESTLERHHVSEALRIVEKSGITLKDKRFFVNAILATDMSKFEENVQKVTVLRGKFNKTDKTQVPLVATLLMMCGNVANTTRPFYFASECGKRILSEYQEISKLEEQNGIQNHQKICGKSITDPLPEIELAFINEIALPLLEILEDVSPDFKDFKVQCQDNKEQWTKETKK